MKKIILGLSLAGLVMSCQKIQEGDNKGVLKMDEAKEGVSGLTFDPEAQGTREHHVASEVASTANDSVRTANVQGVTIKSDSAKTSKVEVK